MGCTGTEIGYLAFYNMQISSFPQGRILYNLFIIYIYIIQIMCVCVCVCVCLSRIGGQTAGPIMTKFGTYMRIDLGMVPP